MKAGSVLKFSAYVLLLTGLAFAQSPIVGGQVRISVDNNSLSGNETSAASSANGQDIVAGFNDWRPDGTIKSSFGTSSDGGQTWSHVIVRPPVANQTTVEGDPMACYDARTNTLWVGAISFAGNGGIYIAKKNLGSNTYQASTMARLSGSADKCWMTAGPIPGNSNTTRLYITYNEGVIRSDDLGTTFTSPTSLGTGLGFLPRVGPNGELYVCYWDDNLRVQFKRSLNGGTSFSTFTAATRMDTWGTESPNGRVPGNYRIAPINTMAVNPVDGTIVIMYFDTTNTIGSNRNLDLYMVKSTNQGTTWTTPTRLPFRPLTTVGDMFFPWVEYTSDGRLHLTAYDTIYTSQNDGITHGMVDEDYAYSDDNGATWSKFRLTPNSYDSFNDGRGSSTSFLGDYEGIAMTDRRVWATYPDTHTGQAEVYANSVYNPIVRPASLSFVWGTQTGGTLQSLFLQDGNVVTATRGVPPLASTPPLQMALTATSPYTNPSSVQLYLWTSVSTPNLQQDVLVYNVAAQRWDTLDSRAAPQSQTNTVVNVPNPQNYIGPNGLMQARVTYRAVGATLTLAWTANTDEAVFLENP
ncbi:MAG TPA: sialidase family protein [Fimbriimonadaceae bacterium]|nr:sialidase family protein [Fimbriimonadaceae bacterium]